MFARLLFVTGVHVAAAVPFLEERASVIAAQRGFRQLAASGDRSAGKLNIISVWDSMDDLEASDAVLANLRQEGLGAFGGQMAVRVFEQVAFGVGETPPQPPCILRLITYLADSSRVDENISWFRNELLPTMMATPGIRAVRNLIDRQTGEGRVGTEYSDQATMELAEPARTRRMTAARDRGIEFGEESILEVLFGQISTT